MTLPGTLIIARHHESEWNKKGMWTGTRDVHLTEYGFEKSKEMGALLKGTRIDNVFASMQVRSIETLSCMLNELEQYHVPAEYTHALDERDYGDYTGKNKWEMEKAIGKEAFDNIRRNWDCPVPNGETLKMVYERVVPFYCSNIVPLLAAGHNVLVVSHGNALRALTIYMESIPHEQAREVEMLFGAVVLYQVDKEGKMLKKEVRQVKSDVNA
jgi:2,3-bisphosphoglycerate-dependent phosphoglycerate mutase